MDATPDQAWVRASEYALRIYDAIAIDTAEYSVTVHNYNFRIKRKLTVPPLGTERHKNSSVRLGFTTSKEAVQKSPTESWSRVIT